MAIDPITGVEKYDPNKVIGSLGSVDDSMAKQVTALASKDSALNQMARTEGLKAANRRGLMNSSMAVGSAQDAVLKNVMPIASQDAATAAAKNAAARQFEYGMTGQIQGQEWQSAENTAQRGFLTGERLGSQEFTTSERVGTQGWQTAENIAQRGFLGTQAELDRDLQQTLQKNQITSDQLMQVKQIASTEGIEAANRELQKNLQENDIQFRMSEGALDRASAEKMQQADITFRKEEGAAERSLQEQIAKWNLSSNDRNAAAQFVTNMETMYQNTYNSIMSNTSLDAKSRETYLTAAKNMRNNQLSMVEQMYNVDLNW